MTVGVLIVGGLWLLTLAASDAPWYVVSGFWLVVGTGIMLWVRRDLNRDLASFDAMREGLESAIRADIADVVDIRARAFVSFEEVEDEGACYAFELPDETVLFLSGQQYYSSAKFPSLDFSLVGALDERGRTVDSWVHTRGPKAGPQRIVPAAVKRTLEMPEDLETIKGTLATLDEILRAGREQSQPER